MRTGPQIKCDQHFLYLSLILYISYKYKKVDKVYSPKEVLSNMLGGFWPFSFPVLFSDFWDRVQLYIRAATENLIDYA